MVFFRFLSTPAGRTLRIIAGLLLFAYGALSPTLLGIVALMGGVAAIVTGFARLPHAPPPSAVPRSTSPRHPR